MERNGVIDLCPSPRQRMLLGIDGCPAGWYVVRTASSGPITCKVYSRFSDILSETPPGSAIAVDIPIGLTEAGSRQCDRLARKALAPTRSCSVFPAPIRAALNAASHAEASAMCRSIDGKGLSIQSYGITRTSSLPRGGAAWVMRRRA